MTRALPLTLTDHEGRDATEQQLCSGDDRDLDRSRTGRVGRQLAPCACMEAMGASTSNTTS